MPNTVRASTGQIATLILVMTLCFTVAAVIRLNLGPSNQEILDYGKKNRDINLENSRLLRENNRIFRENSAKLDRIERYIHDKTTP